MIKRILVTFDIDGTILLADNGRKIQMASIIHAYRQFFGKDPVLKPNPMNLFQFMYHGITDSAAFQSLFIKQRYPFKRSDVLKIIKYYDDFYLQQNLGYVELFPGVRNTIRTIKKMENVYVAIASGSTEKTAKYKLKCADNIIEEFDPFIGAFGENPLRNLCIEKAKELTEIRIGEKIDHVIHLGDTHGDVMSAFFAHATPIAVETGQYKKADFPKFATVIRNMECDFYVILSTIKRLQREG
ncbi:hypothetical protein TRFO_25419 [Tritrichomonas foetus]|uniref:Haloacid dehalogenase-like hydrolase family protein n=1 Tax=Tritrichomonas foetus TaxID=1144522 RepID=A0A1J4KA53_9EUKA|nr:hypothetical protein TRFO_25419 [Tritrichomonas foetus]|eukprot:OHT06534.1 hypothetical protein TRFO_25419 [Tritrichomonas foetus]